jgi:hypothetical protein
MRLLILASLLALASCATFEPPPPDVPTSGPVAYTCADGTQLMVDYTNNEARVAIVGGPSMVLPNAGGDYYSNGRYGIRGAGASAQWEVGRRAPVNCRGS